MDKVYHCVFPEDLPESYRSYMDSDFPIPESIIFYGFDPQLKFRLIVFMFFTFPFVIGTVYFLYLYLNALSIISSLDRVIGLLALMVAFVASFLCLDSFVEGFRLNKMIQRGEWRKGLFILKDGLLIQMKGEDCYLIPKQCIVKIEKSPINDSLFFIELHYQLKDKIQSLRLNPFNLLLMNNIQSERLLSSDLFSRLVEWIKIH